MPAGLTQNCNGDASTGREAGSAALVGHSYLPDATFLGQHALGDEGETRPHWGHCAQGSQALSLHQVTFLLLCCMCLQ
jgi:hypothetical protein